MRLNCRVQLTFHPEIIVPPSKSRRTFNRFPIFWLLAIFFSAPGITAGDAEDSPDQRLRNAHSTFHEMMDAPDKGIPLDLFNKSECIVIIPGVKKAAFIVGGKYGRGFVSCRRGTSRRFGAPAAIRIEGGSYGLQIGGSSTDVFMLVMNDGGMKKLMADKFTIGGEAAAAAGPIGRNTSADTDVLLHAEILTWSRARGLFAGVALSGATLREDSDWNNELYGRKITNREIITSTIAPPDARDRLSHVSSSRARPSAPTLD